MLNEETALLWLSSILCVGIKNKHRLLEYFGSALAAAQNGVKGFVECGVKENNARKAFEEPPEYAVARILGEMYKKEMSFVSFESGEFPERLRTIPDCPIGLFVVGKLPDESKKHLGVVGSRRCTSYGATTTFDLTKEIATDGVVVVSGMAEGIDSMAHKGALAGQGITIAVLGCGADVCYPAINRSLMEQIKAEGCIVSELPPGTRADRYTFPARNRIISGLSDVVAVMEADERSGTLITVNHALEQGRDVMALPGNVTSRLSRGTNRLIKEGAAIITGSEDILNCLGIEKQKIEKNSENYNISLAPEVKLVYDCIRWSPITCDEIAAKLQKPARDVNYALTMLELSGAVTKLSGNKYIQKQK